MSETGLPGNMTPMMKQYFELKGQSKDSILFFRMGDFYEIFGDDAEKVAPLLELVLTSRERGDKKRIPFCGVPHHSAKNYWLKLIALGFKVSLADQLEDPAEAKGLVKRGIVRTITPGSLCELDALEQSSANYLMGFFECPKTQKQTLLIADVSTGEMRIGNIQSTHELKSYVEKYRPVEFLARKIHHLALSAWLKDYLSERSMLMESIPEGVLRDDDGQRAILQDTFGKQMHNAQPCGDVVCGQELVSGVLTYLRDMGNKTAQFLTIKPLADPEQMLLTGNVISDLEVFSTARRQQVQGSLFYEINKTQTPMGARFLRYSLAHPMKKLTDIRQRLTKVKMLAGFPDEDLQNLRGWLRKTPDLQRLATRVLAALATPHELAKIRQGLHSAMKLWEIFEGISPKANQGMFVEIKKGLRFYKRPFALLESAIQENPSALGSGDVFREGYDKELDQLRGLSAGSEQEVSRYQDELREQTGIQSLKVKNHKSFGLLIEVTKSNIKKVPAHFIRKQTMVNCERFKTEALEELNERCANASVLLLQCEQNLYQELFRKLSMFRVDLASVTTAIAEMDLLQSFAFQAKKENYVEPTMGGSELRLKGSRHPVIERLVGNFSANDILLDPSSKHMLLTGPNMAGKSTLMRQVAVTALMAQCGSFVPAAEADLPIFDRIFTRVGASDDITKGQSTFMVEMSEAADILRNGTASSLVILDEVGRGTSTQDGLALAAAILVDVAKRLRCYAFFSTHYHELTEVARPLKQVKVMQTEVIEKNDGIIFTHRLKSGPSSSSYGLEVAKLAGIPEQVIASARGYLNVSEPTENTRAASSVTGKNGPRAPRQGAAHLADKPRTIPLDLGLSEVPADSELVERLRRIDVNRLTPIQAINIINDLKLMVATPLAKELFCDLT